MRRLLIPVLLLAACGGETAVSTTTAVPVEPPSTSTTTSTTVESTTPAPTPIDICPRGVVWQPGLAYVAECFEVPVSFSVEGAGFGSEGASGEWLVVRWRDPDDREFGVRVGLLSYRSGDSPLEVLEAITTRKGIAASSEPRATTLAGRDASMVEVEGLPREGLGEGEDPCFSDGYVRFVSGGGGNPIMEGVGRADAIGVSYCDVATVWAVQVDERTITVIAGSDDPARHQEALEIVEGLFDGMAFEVAGS